VKITLAVVGRLKEQYFVAAEEEYRKRLRPMCTLTVHEAKDEAALLAALPANAHLYAFDERGASMSSVAFAHDILGAADREHHRRSTAVLLLGADGHSDAVRKRARKLISFGQLTIAHRLVRLLVLEQLYRGFKILRGEPYHRD